MGRFLVIIGSLFFILSITSNYFDLNLHFTGSKGVTQIGQLWYYLSPSSLQMFEVIISRYVDPCVTLDILNCTQFLWHPMISSILILPAAPVLAILAFFFITFGLRKRKRIFKK